MTTQALLVISVKHVVDGNPAFQNRTITDLALLTFMTYCHHTCVYPHLEQDDGQPYFESRYLELVEQQRFGSVLDNGTGALLDHNPYFEFTTACNDLMAGCYREMLSLYLSVRERHAINRVVSARLTLDRRNAIVHLSLNHLLPAPQP